MPHYVGKATQPLGAYGNNGGRPPFGPMNTSHRTAPTMPVNGGVKFFPHLLKCRCSGCYLLEMLYIPNVHAAPDEISYATDGVGDYKLHDFNGVLFINAIHLENTLTTCF